MSAKIGKDPFVLNLYVLDNLKIELVIKNVTKEEQLLKYDMFHNPMKMRIFDNLNKEIVPADERASMFYSAEMEPPVNLLPGKEKIIKSKFNLVDNKYELRWEFYTYHLSPGQYTAYIEFHNGIGLLPGLIFKSNIVEINLK